MEVVIKDVSEKEIQETKLMNSARSGDHQGILESLAGGADAKARGGSGISALDAASASGSIPSVKALLDAGADPKIPGLGGRTSLHWAVLAGNGEITSLLIEAGAEVNARDVQGSTALSLAALNARPDCAMRLARAGADPDIKDVAGVDAFGELNRSLHRGGQALREVSGILDLAQAACAKRALESAVSDMSSAMAPRRNAAMAASASRSRSL
jgi:ankyrin repeat protein